MQVFPVEVDVSLPQDRAVDLFLLQCHSPDPLEGGAPGKLPAQVSVTRLALLTSFYKWIRDTYCPQNPLRPYFVVTPELAVSADHLDVLRNIARAGQGPAVVLAGLDFLTWDEYQILLHAMPDMPDPDSWTEGGNPAHRLNTAIIFLQESGGLLREFIQPKRNPSDREAATHFPCQNVLFFHSKTQAQGRRLNFSVQICSDFTNSKNVREFRRECELKSNGMPVDFTFLLERNPDQSAPQFQGSIETYFEPPEGMVDTSPGCLVFANAASEYFGKSTSWGKSMLLFPWNRIHWKTYGSHTYWLRDQKANNYQAVVLREPGACIYWLRYKPHYLVNPIAGSGHPGPFVDNHALALILDGDHFPAAPVFHTIPAVTHWLLSEWTYSQPEFLEQLDGLPPEVVEGCKTAHDLARSSWKDVLLANEKLSRNTLSLYFSCFRDQVLSEKTLEPVLWDPAIATGARRFLSVYALLKSGLPEAALSPRPTPYAHSLLCDDTLLSLVWGQDHPVSAVLTATLSALDKAAGHPDKDRHIIILVSPLDPRDRGALKALIQESLKQFTDASNDAAEHFDDITSTRGLGEIIPICDYEIWTSVTSAPNMEAIQEQITTLLGVGAA